MKEALLGFIRHILTFGGGFLASNGWITEGQIEVAVGAVITLIGIAWSAWDKKSTADKLASQ